MLLLPKLQNLPKILLIEGAVRIELVEGISIFCASSTVQNREELLEKQQISPLNSDEEQELDRYEAIDGAGILVPLKKGDAREISIDSNEANKV